MLNSSFSRPSPAVEIVFSRHRCTTTKTVRRFTGKSLICVRRFSRIRGYPPHGQRLLLLVSGEQWVWALDLATHVQGERIWTRASHFSSWWWLCFRISARFSSFAMFVANRTEESVHPCGLCRASVDDILRVKRTRPRITLLKKKQSNQLSSIIMEEIAKT